MGGGRGGFEDGGKGLGRGGGATPLKKETLNFYCHSALNSPGVFLFVNSVDVICLTWESLLLVT